MGIVSAVVFCNLGAAYGTAKSGVGICAVSVLKRELMFKSLIPAIMAGILGIYGLIISVILYLKASNANVPYTAGSIDSPSTWTGKDYYTAYKCLASGLCCGLSCLASGLCIGVCGDAGVRANAQRDIYMAVILMMIFAEALGLYGVIVAVVLGAV